MPQFCASCTSFALGLHQKDFHGPRACLVRGFQHSDLAGMATRNRVRLQPCLHWHLAFCMQPCTVINAVLRKHCALCVCCHLPAAWRQQHAMCMRLRWDSTPKCLLRMTHPLNRQQNLETKDWAGLVLRWHAIESALCSFMLLF